MGKNERAKIVMSDEEIAEFIERSRTATMATVLPDGRPHLVAMWYAVVDGEIWFETKAKSQKAVNLRRDPTITVMIEDGQSYDTLRGVSIDGHAEIVDDPETNLRVGKSVWERYTGPYTDEMRPFVDQMMHNRICVRVVPSRMRSWDHRKLGMDRDADWRQHRAVSRLSHMDADKKPPKQLNAPFVKTGMKYSSRAVAWAVPEIRRQDRRQLAGRCRIQEAGADAAARAPRPQVRQAVRLAAGVHQRRRRRDRRRVDGWSRREPAVVPQPDRRSRRAHRDRSRPAGGARRSRQARRRQDRLWPKLVEAYADFDAYKAWTDRDIPVFILKPR